MELHDLFLDPVLDKAAEWTTQASLRRSQTPGDVGADAMAYCATELTRLVASLRSELQLVSVGDYAAEMGVSEQTVRNWIEKGRLPEIRVPRGLVLPRFATPADE